MFFLLDVEYRFTCGELNLYENAANSHNVYVHDGKFLDWLLFRNVFFIVYYLFFLTL